MVVGLHANFLADIDPLGSFLTVNGVFRVAVPIFLLINGYYFCSVLTKVNQVYWLKRLLFLYVFWMIFYSPFWLGNVVYSPVELVKVAVFGYGHLWYISGLLISAVSLLILRKLPSLVIYFIITITFITATIFQYLNHFYLFEKQILNEVVKSYLYISALSFFLLGYSINRYNLYYKISKKVLVLLTFFGFSVLLGEAYFNYIQMGVRKGVDIYLSLIFICPVIFLLFLKLNVQWANKKLSMYSTGVYLIHIFILALFRKYTIFSETELTILVILVSIVFSYFLMQINKKLKFVL